MHGPARTTETAVRGGAGGRFRLRAVCSDLGRVSERTGLGAEDTVWISLAMCRGNVRSDIVMALGL